MGGVFSFNSNEELPQVGKKRRRRDTQDGIRPKKKQRIESTPTEDYLKEELINDSIIVEEQPPNDNIENNDEKVIEESEIVEIDKLQTTPTEENVESASTIIQPILSNENLPYVLYSQSFSDPISEITISSLLDTSKTNTVQTFLKGVRWSPDGTCFLTSSEDKIVRLYET